MRHLALVLLFAAAAAAQSPDGIVVTASRNVSITPDEADFAVVVTASLDTTQQQITQIFRDAGIQNVNVVSVAAGQNMYSTYPPPADSQAGYQITFTTAPGALKDTAKALDKLRAGLPAGVLDLQFSAVLGVSQAAVDAAHQAALPQLLADARTRAQALSTAAGLKLGAIQGVSETAYSSPYAVGGISVGSFVNGYFSSSALLNGPTPQYTFYASVKFAAQ